MKKTVLLSSILLTSIFAFDLKSIATEVGKNIPSSTNQSQNKSNLDNSTISSGLKEALKSGVTFATTQLGKKDGYLNNKDVRIPLPPNLANAETLIRKAGGDKMAEWIFWIQDLAEMDPYFVLPILMGATMFLQQKITPNTMQDEMQKKIFQFLPVIFTFFFLWFPAGLTLYWFINNLFTIGQQYYINSVFERKRVEKN